MKWVAGGRVAQAFDRVMVAWGVVMLPVALLTRAWLAVPLLLAGLLATPSVWRRAKGVPYALYLRLRIVTPRTCHAGRCWCRRAADCYFPRCRNCDNPLNDVGMALDDGKSYDEHYRCPFCGGGLVPF